MNNKKNKFLRFACYSSNITMSVVGNLSPLLFLTFRSIYGISYSLLGLLVLLNFSTQLTVDLFLSFFSNKINIRKIVILMPILALSGLCIYSVYPLIFPGSAFVGILIGTVIFSASAGLSEVLISPIFASIPSKNPERDMSKLHAIYAWGVVGVVFLTTMFLLVFGKERWYFLSLIFMILPLCGTILFALSDIPNLNISEKSSDTGSIFKNKTVFVYIFAIFLGGAAECTMAQWASGYLETALGISKVYGDIFGVALFSAALGFGRTLFSKIGKHPSRALLLGGIGATVCYTAAALSPFPVIGLLACGFTGFCVSMLWPGCLVVGADRFPTGGVVIYALLAAGGDMGASVGPQLVGMITDAAINSDMLISISSTLSLTPDQLGMKLGILVGALFPLISIPIYASFRKREKKEERLKALEDPHKN